MRFARHKPQAELTLPVALNDPEPNSEALDMFIRSDLGLDSDVAMETEFVIEKLTLISTFHREDV